MNPRPFPINRQTLKNMEWISVKDRLPDEDTYEVLVKVDEPFFGKTTPRMIVAYYAEEEKTWQCELTSRQVHHVTHWMPLPPPPTATK